MDRRAEPWERFFERRDETRERFERVVDLVAGFESAFGLELLATVHWILDHETDGPMEDVVARTHAWDERKKQLSPRQIGLAADTLIEKSWIENVSRQGP